MTRPQSALALVQCSLIVLGYLSLILVLKLMGYPSPDYVWNAEAVLVLHYGLLAFLIPAGFVLVFWYLEQRHPHLHSTRGECFLGVVLCLYLLLTFAFAIAQGCRSPFRFSVQRTLLSFPPPRTPLERFTDQIADEDHTRHAARNPD